MSGSDNGDAFIFIVGIIAGILATLVIIFVYLDINKDFYCRGLFADKKAEIEILDNDECARRNPQTGQWEVKSY